MNLALIFLGGLIVTVGDLVLKQWVRSSSLLYYLAGIALYTMGGSLLALSFREKDIAVASVIFIVFNVITLTIAGMILYEEHLTYSKVIGICLALASIIILEIFP
jgi:multidrug transporter EmrE-like cation transporter